MRRAARRPVRAPQRAPLLDESDALTDHNPRSERRVGPIELRVPLLRLPADEFVRRFSAIAKKVGIAKARICSAAFA